MRTLELEENTSDFWRKNMYYLHHAENCPMSRIYKALQLKEQAYLCVRKAKSKKDKKLYLLFEHATQRIWDYNKYLNSLYKKQVLIFLHFPKRDGKDMEEGRFLGVMEKEEGLEIAILKGKTTHYIKLSNVSSMVLQTDMDTLYTNYMDEIKEIRKSREN
jgi:DNA mismatch repair ATPase MutL